MKKDYTNILMIVKIYIILKYQNLLLKQIGKKLIFY